MFHDVAGDLAYLWSTTEHYGGAAVTNSLQFFKTYYTGPLRGSSRMNFSEYFFFHGVNREYCTPLIHELLALRFRKVSGHYSSWRDHVCGKKEGG